MCDRSFIKSHYETDFSISSAFGAGNTKIGFLKAIQRLAFKKPIFIMRIAGALQRCIAIATYIRTNQNPNNVRRREAPPHIIWVLCPNKNGDRYR
jgi:hypothetical protein